MSTDLVPLRQPVVTFSGGPLRYEADRAGAPRFQIAYRAPRDTMDPRYAACTNHRVACDCREAEHAEEMAEHRAEWASLRDAARRALAGHQIDHPMGLTDIERLGFPLCLCSGCVVHRETGNLLRWADVDFRTGRVKRPDFGWTPGEVPF